MTLIASHDISFESAIALTERFIEQINTIDEKQKQEIITSLVQSANGSRGFFVTYLTSDNPIVGQVSSGIIDGLKSSPEIVSELLVKNIAMSTAMKITHNRNNNPEMAQQSEIVTSRSLKLVNLLQLAQINSKIAKMCQSITKADGDYEQFFQRWGYDDEQKKAIYDTLCHGEKRS